MQAKYPDREPIEKALRLIIGRQQPNGEWLQEAIEGVFNKSWYVNQTNTHSVFPKHHQVVFIDLVLYLYSMISYPNHKFNFPIKALGMFARRYGDLKLG